jgi:RNA polymerase sigma-70 factor, ECF subfamily
MRTTRERAVLLSGVDSAFQDFFLAEYDKLFRAMWLASGDRAEGEDLAQEAMARAYEQWTRVSLAHKPVAYVYRIAFNLNRRRARRHSLFLRTIHDLSSVIRTHGEDPSLDAERQAVRDAVAALPREQREALLLVEWLGLSPDEAAAELGIKPVSVRGRLHRAREGLRSQLGGEQ